MRLNIRGENLQVTEAIRAYIIKKVEKLEKYFDGPIHAEVQVKFKVYDQDTKVEISIPLKTLLLRAEEQHKNMYAAIDLIVDKLERQVRKYKTKVNRKPRQEQAVRKNAANAVLLMEPENELLVEEEDNHIVRTKRFNLKPMDIEEAILQMNLLGHQFFIFTDAETATTNIVYPRNDGKYAIIETV